MDDITKVLEERQKQLVENPEDSTTATAVTAEVPSRDAPLTVVTEETKPAEGDFVTASPSGLTLVATMEGGAALEASRPAEAEATEPPKPTREQIVEALLFAATSPLPETRLREITRCTPEQVAATVAALNQQYEASVRAFRIHRIAQGYQLYTLPEYSEWVRGLFKTQRTIRLSKASLETLAIVAYKQPVTKPEIEQYRGVDVTAPVVTLLERKLIVLAGRAHKPGNPFLYRTSREFLRYFGLGSLDDLPRPEELEAFLRQREEQAEAEDAALLGTTTEEVAAPKIPLEESDVERSVAQPQLEPTASTAPAPGAETAAAEESSEEAVVIEEPVPVGSGI